ncbi:MAG: FAD binding domain-containing protein, partial [Candidatus Dormibacteraceae bacterium]
MEFLRPGSLEEALGMRRATHAVPIAGGTDLMVDLNFDRRRPDVLLDLSRLSELREWAPQDPNADGGLRIGAGVTYTRLCAELSGLLPGLAAASRTVGSPHIRNRGTIGGNLAT